MKGIRGKLLTVAVCATAAGCSTVSLAPGADAIKVSRNPADMAGCASLGNVGHPPPMMTDPDVERQMRNETVNLGGNALLVTSQFGRTGIAYRCGDAAKPSAATAGAPAIAPEAGTTPSAAGTAPAESPGLLARAASAAARALQPSTDVRTPIETVQAQVDAYNRRDLEGFLGFYADDAQLFDYPDQRLIAGKDALRERYRQRFEPAPKLHAEILQRIAFDRFVIDQERVTGLADGQGLEVVAIYEIRDGRIARVTFLRH
jgi:hypothetical protein